MSGVQDCQVYLLDDILASVDSHVAAWLIAHAINGPLLQHKTRVVCSNSRLLSLIADQTVRLYRGKIISNEQPLDAEEKAVRGGASVRGGTSVRGVHDQEASPLSVALGLAGKLNLLGVLPFDSCTLHIHACMHACMHRVSCAVRPDLLQCCLDKISMCAEAADAANLDAANQCTSRHA